MTTRFATIFGVILLLLGFLGFVSNPLIGSDALFASDSTHNLLHILLGAILLGVAYWSRDNALLWLRIVGGVLAVLGLLGLLMVPTLGGTLLGLIYTNGAYNWFHLAMGAAMLFAGVHHD